MSERNKKDLIGMSKEQNYFTGYTDGKKDGVAQIIAECEKIDACEFAMYSLGLLRELAEKILQEDAEE